MLPSVADARAAQAADLPFSIGAAGITILWLFFHGRPGTALLLIGLNIGLRVLGALSPAGAVLALLVCVAVIVYFGSEGSKIAMAHKHYGSVDDLKAGEHGWTVAGWIGLAISLLLLTISLLSL